MLRMVVDKNFLKDCDFTELYQQGEDAESFAERICNEYDRVILIGNTLEAERLVSHNGGPLRVQSSTTISYNMFGDDLKRYYQKIADQYGYTFEDDEEE